MWAWVSRSPSTIRWKANQPLQFESGFVNCTILHTQPLLPQSPISSSGPALVPQIQGENPGAQSVQYRGVLGTILTMVRTEGPRSPYSGLVAGLHRQMSFASIRIGLYDSVKQFYTPKGEDRECQHQGHPGVGGSSAGLWVKDMEWSNKENWTWGNW